MAQRLPPLNSLRAFAVAARHLSFTKAAAELNVTPAAVSQQVRILEDFIGTALFRRHNRSLLLTDAGQACLPGLIEGFEKLAEAMGRIGTAGRTGVLTVSVAPSFAAKWLVPRLDSFREAHPEIDVRVSASVQLVDFAREDVDIAIRYGGGKYPGLDVQHLLPESVQVVCSPQLLEGEHPLKSPTALRVHTLLHDDNPEQDPTCPDWRMWLKAAGIGDVDWTRGPRFNQSSLVLEAAISGRGVALAKSTLAKADLAAGRLVNPFGGRFPVEFAYHVVVPPAKSKLPKVLMFREWLMAEAKATEAAA
jgi:LysR family transcriptional regulator, glycine cleavage system transcriptional activator